VCRYPFLFSIIIFFCAFFGEIFWGFGWIDWRIWGHAWYICVYFEDALLNMLRNWIFLKISIKLPETSSRNLKSSTKRLITLNLTPTTPKSTKITPIPIIPLHFSFIFLLRLMSTKLNPYISCSYGRNNVISLNSRPFICSPRILSNNIVVLAVHYQIPYIMYWMLTQQTKKI